MAEIPPQNTNSNSARSAAVSDESAVDVRGYLGALRRSRGLIIATVLLITGGVLALSLVLPKQYQAVARVVMDEQASVLGQTDAESTQRRLATNEALLGSEAVLAAAAEQVPGETADSLGSAVDSSVDENANIINIFATDRDPDKAAAISNAVANAFLAAQAEAERERAETAKAGLLEQIDSLEASGAPNAAAQIQAIRTRISEIGVQEASAGSDLQLAEAAGVPTVPSTPKPLRNSILALFGSLFVGVLLALGRDQLRPRISSSRELGRLAGGLPVLSEIPYIRKRRIGSNTAAASAAEHEAYRTLRSSLKQVVQPTGQVILITSALHEEGKTTVTARLGRALAASGNNTLMISADLRIPKLHQFFGVGLTPGLTEAIEFVDRSGLNESLLPSIVHSIGPAAGDRSDVAVGYELHLLTSGANPDDPPSLLAKDSAKRLFAHIETFDFDYILIDAPPLLGISDVQALAPYCDQMLLVTRLDRVSTENVIDTQELLARLRIRPMGLVVIGGTTDASPYYYLADAESRGVAVGAS